MANAGGLPVGAIHRHHSNRDLTIKRFASGFMINVERKAH
ncbi:hypothetical protein C4J85_4553 [Pseudomonas sp. R4-34-07]|nr:hypothetical protein C4J85_4553 [Pseudomonas sp. R4-34-07]